MSHPLLWFLLGAVALSHLREMATPAIDPVTGLEYKPAKNLDELIAKLQTVEITDPAEFANLRKVIADHYTLRPEHRYTLYFVADIFAQQVDDRDEDRPFDHATLERHLRDGRFLERDLTYGLKPNKTIVQLRDDGQVEAYKLVEPGRK